MNIRLPADRSNDKLAVKNSSDKNIRLPYCSISDRVASFWMISSKIPVFQVANWGWIYFLDRQHPRSKI